MSVYEHIKTYIPDYLIPFDTSPYYNPFSPYYMDPNGGWQGQVTWNTTNENYLTQYDPTMDAYVLKMNVGRGISDPTVSRLYRYSGTYQNQPLVDQDYTVGVFIKLDFSFEETQADPYILPLMRFGNSGHYFRVANTETRKGALTWVVPGFGTVDFSLEETNLNDQQWHFIAVSVQPSGQYKLFFDGQQIFSAYGSTPTTGSQYLEFGDPAASIAKTNPYPANMTYFSVSNLFIAQTSRVGDTEIASIWNYFNSAPVNATVSESPATASANITDPTVIAVIADNVYITTSIAVSAAFPSNIAVGTQTNIQVTSHVAMEASGDVTNNVSVVTGQDGAFAVPEFTASAELITPFVARSPMEATAQMGNHVVTVNPSYLNLVLNSSPVIYSTFDSSSFNNRGSWGIDSVDVGSTVVKNVPSEGKLGVVGEGLSWKFEGNYYNAPNYVNIYPSVTEQEVTDLVQSEFTLEFWIKPTAAVGASISFGSFCTLGYYKPNQTMYVNFGHTLPTWETSDNDFPSTYSSRFILGNANAINPYIWNYVALTFKNGLGTLYVNNSVAGSLAVTLDEFTSGTAILVKDSDGDVLNDFGANRGWIDESNYNTSSGNSYIDELAIYPTALSNSAVLDHYSFINNLSPDFEYFSEVRTVTAQSGNHNFVVNANAVPNITAALSSIEFVNPELIPGQSAEILADIIDGSANIVQPRIDYATTYSSTTFESYAESTNAFALNTIYYDYVQANILPYRYASFDGSNVLQDYGSDTGYSVDKVSFSGTVVNPDFGITGKSIKTSGINYASGVILLESEHDDDWGTGTDTYHSSFWFQRASDDSSVNGLRVLWNLNGHYDNQHVVLYQYANKLYLNFNNGSGTFIEQESTNSYDLFDYERHFIGISFDHTGVNNFVTLFVDGVIAMVVDLGQYSGSTINSPTYLAPNDPANNFPRIGVGCLITPFNNTALQIVPTNTKIYVDEVIWAKTELTETLAQNLFNVMPDKDNGQFLAASLEASAEFVNPTNITSSLITAESFIANSIIEDAGIVADRNTQIISAIMIADAEISDAERSDTILIISDIFLASASTGDGTVLVTVAAQPMNVTAELLDRPYEGIYILTDIVVGAGLGAQRYYTSYFYTLSKWAAWLRSTDSGSILPTREIK